MSTTPSRLASGAVGVWYARPTDVWRSPEEVTRARDALPPRDRARYDGLRRQPDRDLFLLGRVMARALVGNALGLAPDAWPWREDQRGRPEIDLPDCPWSFNVAHSGQMVACAIGRDVHVGVDLESPLRRDLDRRLITRCCSPEEQAAILAPGADQWADRFLVYWTLKESYLKGCGLGITVPLRDLSFDLTSPEIRLTLLGSLAAPNHRWTFRHQTIDAHHLAVAAQGDAHTPISIAPLPPALVSR
jgi:4'-phosphopantetheinyl transferase